MSLTDFVTNLKESGYLVTIYKNEAEQVFKVKVAIEGTTKNIVQLVPFERCIGSQDSWEFLMRAIINNLVLDLNKDE